MKLKTLLLTLILALLTTPALAERPKVLTTTGMIADIVENLAGEYVELSFLMGPGIDPHAYRATHGDIRKLKEAEIVFFNGLSLEGKMEQIFEKLSKKKVIVAVASEISKDSLLAAADYQNAFDPHIWFDVSLWLEAVKQVEKTLVKSISEKSEEIKSASLLYQNKLVELDSWIKSQVSQIPEKKRLLVTAHDAFRYFGHRYGIEVMGLQGISSDSDYGLRDVKRLSDVIIEREVNAVFIESSVPPKFINSLRRAVLAKGHKVELGGTLYSDAMGVAGSGHDNYLGMFKYNVETIVGALK